MESFLSQAGYAAVLLFGFLEACCVPIPSEVTFGFAGVLAAEGHLNILLVIVLGTVAELLGSLVSYSVGRVGGRPLVDRFGRYLLVTQADVDRAERFFAGRGAWAVPVGRALPFVRTFISIVAGFIAMPALEFGVLSLIGTAAWVTTISLVGYAVGGAWQSVSHGLSIAGYLIAAVVIAAILAFVLYRLREFRRYGAEQALARAQAPASDPPGGGYSGGGQPRGDRPGGDYPGVASPVVTGPVVTTPVVASPVVAGPVVTTPVASLVVTTPVASLVVTTPPVASPVVASLAVSTRATGGRRPGGPAVTPSPGRPCRRRNGTAARVRSPGRGRRVPRSPRRPPPRRLPHAARRPR